MTIFEEISIWDVWLDSEYASEVYDSCLIFLIDMFTKSSISSTYNENINVNCCLTYFMSLVLSIPS